MSLRDEICHALCDGFAVSNVPIGFAVKSPFKWYSGDNLTFYVRLQNVARLDSADFESTPSLFDPATVPEPI